MAQVAERLIILTDIGEGLLIRLYNTRNKLEGPTKPAFLTDPALQKGSLFNSKQHCWFRILLLRLGFVLISVQCYPH